jgi:hypothetical protein
LLRGEGAHRLIVQAFRNTNKFSIDGLGSIALASVSAKMISHSEKLGGIK